MRKFFFIDYDNTIFSHYSHSIPRGAAEALLKLQKAGHKVILSSGRGLSDELLPDLPENFKPDGLVGANGAIVVIDGQKIWENPMNEELKNRLMVWGTSGAQGRCRLRSASLQARLLFLYE